MKKKDWYSEAEYEELYKNNYEKLEEIRRFLHGYCDEWVLNNFRPNDTAIIWCDYDDVTNKTYLIHCYIIRNGYFVDIRGKTKSIELIEEEYDYGEFERKIYCTTLEEFKAHIRNICGYLDNKWQ